MVDSVGVCGDVGQLEGGLLSEVVHEECLPSVGVTLESDCEGRGQ